MQLRFLVNGFTLTPHNGAEVLVSRSLRNPRGSHGRHCHVPWQQGLMPRSNFGTFLFLLET